MLKTVSKILILIISPFLFIACPKEDENLISPASQLESIHVRFVNYGGDDSPRQLLMNFDSKTDIAEWGKSTPAINPPSDSATAKVLNSGDVEFEAEKKLRFARDLNYTVFALPFANGDSVQGNVNSLISITSSSIIDENSTMAYTAVINVIPDYETTYSVTVGCPNGDIIVSNLKYKNYGFHKEVRSGLLPVSLIKNGPNGTELLGLYEIELKEKGQYIYIITKDENGDEDLKILDQMDFSANCIVDVPEKFDNFTSIRAINFSEYSIDIIKEPGELVADKIAPNRIGAYIDVEACKSQSYDVINIYSESGDSLSSISEALEVKEKYTVLVFDSAGTQANKVMIIDPLRKDYGNMATVQVIHQAELLEGLTISIGAREDSDPQNNLNFTAGKAIADKMTYGKISNVTPIEPGYGPIVVFNSLEPANYLFSAVTNFEAGKNYLFVITNTADGKNRTTLIEHSDENSDIVYIDEGIMVDVVNAHPYKESIAVSVDPALSGARLFYGSSLTTILPTAGNSFDLNGNTFDLSSSIEYRSLLVYSGTLENPKTFIFENEPMLSDGSEYKIRFINATPEYNSINIKFDEEGKNIFSNLAYGEISDVKREIREKSISLYFYNSTTGDLIERIDAPRFVFRKNYVIIFAGHSAYGGYSAIIQQEF